MEETETTCKSTPHALRIDSENPFTVYVYFNVYNARKLRGGSWDRQIEIQIIVSDSDLDTGNK